MLEKEIEQHLVARCKTIGALCDKFTSPNRRSVPDRMITFECRVYFVELKAPGKKPTEGQLRDHKKRATHGFHVWVVDSKEGVDRLINTMVNLSDEFPLRGENGD